MFAGKDIDYSSATIRNDGFWPDVAVADFERRRALPADLDQQTTGAALLAAVSEINQQLARHRAALLAKSVKVRQARFAGRITASKQEGLLAWQVQFTLKEFNSVPEKREQRLPQKATAVGQSTANTSTAKPGDTESGDEEQDLSSFERYVLKPMDDMLA